MAYTVAKPFKTLTRRLSPGMTVDAADIDGALSAEQWTGLGYLQADAPALSAPASAPPQEQPAEPEAHQD